MKLVFFLWTPFSSWRPLWHRKALREQIPKICFSDKTNENCLFSHVIRVGLVGVAFFKLLTALVSTTAFRHELNWFSVEYHRSKTKLLSAWKQHVRPTFSESLPSNGLAAKYQLCKAYVSLNAPFSCQFAVLIRWQQCSRNQKVVHSVQGQRQQHLTS